MGYARDSIGAPRPGLPVQLLHERCEDETMLVMRPSHKDSTCVFNIRHVLSPKRGNGQVECSGLINGIFGSGEERHIAAWKSKKMTTKTTEEEPDGTTIIRERERFVQELSVVSASGETGTLE
jgi:hypothetical protein